VAAELEKRSKERVSTALPVILGQAAGVTRDVSASGIFFETSAALDAGGSIDFSIELESPGGKMLLICSGEIVRKESRGDRLGVAVKITDSRMELVKTPVQQTEDPRQHSLRATTGI
jgi:hypothetical protein